ncbi:hypothetical protein GCM10027155_13350 [Acinetobacter apis]|uniref:Sporulation related domain-containing protein n=1 Tax=Acinetobacter apis TaxID=1229165 RepID=A0A217EHD6_9GAMM|nr:SPOR domain-containing protein [Acinetobacter apis]SNQ29919.1 Sporulation related domain-containing protein [Acinetobacter apis]
MAMNSKQRWMGGIVLLGGGVLLTALLFKGANEIKTNQASSAKPQAEVKKQPFQPGEMQALQPVTIDVETEKRLLEEQRHAREKTLAEQEARTQQYLVQQQQAEAAAARKAAEEYAEINARRTREQENLDIPPEMTSASNPKVTEKKLSPEAEAKRKALLTEKAKTDADIKRQNDVAEKKLKDAEIAKQKADHNVKVKADLDKKAHDDLIARKKLESEMKAKAEAEAKKKAELEAKKKAEREAKVKAEAESKAKADAKAKAEGDAKAKAELDAKKKADLDAKHKHAEEEKKKQQDLAKQKAEAEQKKKLETENAREIMNEGKKWMVQVALAVNQGNADSIISKLKAKGYAITTSPTSKGIRVMVGPSKDREHADALRKKIQADPSLGFKSAWVIEWMPLDQRPKASSD